MPVNTNMEQIEAVVRKQREFFATGATHSASARILMLKDLYDAI